METKVMTPSRAIVLIALCIAAATSQAASQSTGAVRVTGGDIAGSRADTLNTYLGIPFAAPPVGDLRWRSPQPVQPWKGVKTADKFSASCAQTVPWMTGPQSEDCLYLNVWSPEKASKLPIIVWIYGGGFRGGSASQAQFNGANLAKHGAVVVSLNYRLGILGFFGHPELAAESPHHASGNQGIQDQIAALRWVKSNIASFGGDPGRVTIMGESAGAGSVSILIASPLAKGLFQRAIAESGVDAQNSQFDRKGAEAKGVALGEAMGAPRLADLRGKSVADLHKQPWSPRVFIDGYVLPEDLPTAYRNHRQNDVPLLAGWNAEEGNDLAPEILGTTEFKAADRRAQVTQLLGSAPSDALLAAYPAATDSQAQASMTRLTTDWWGWRMSRWASIQAKYGSSKPYLYFYTYRSDGRLNPCGYGCGAGHTAEIRFVFDNLNDGRVWSEADRQLASRLADTWVAFAATGSPNGKGLPAWPAYDGSQGSVFRIGGHADKLPDLSVFPPLVD
jgi:para-nitrobenzyl esterase